MKTNGYLPLLAAVAAVAMYGANVAVAADLSRVPPLKAPPFVPPPFTWTGFYVGGNLGFAWAQHNVTDSISGVSIDTARRFLFIGGGQVGFNYQAGWFVGGVEGDFDGVANNGSTGNAGTPIEVTSTHRWIATLAARLGVATDNWLFYGKVGGGWVDDRFTVADLTTGGSIDIGSGTRGGWLAGAGIEWAILNNWTVKLEYDYVGLGSRSFTIPVGAPLSPSLIGDTFPGSRSVQEVKVGFNYLFHWGAPLAAPY
jgi:outer membrane immunogenic protein